MNDFTKEELISIEFCIDVSSGGDLHIRDSRKQLLAKIQRMIDNYCEHELECSHTWECELAELPEIGNEIPLMPTITKVKCNKCGCLYYE